MKDRIRSGTWLAVPALQSGPFEDRLLICAPVAILATL